MGRGAVGSRQRPSDAGGDYSRSRAGLRLSVFGISRDAKYYVHTYARLLSDLYVVEELK